MATIKLGDLTLGKVAIGNSTIGDMRKLDKQKIFRSQAIRNHTEDKTVERKLTRYVRPTEEVGGDVDLGGNAGNESTWLLADGTWNDNGVWDDTQNWTE